ncbi:DUF3050 domain-containing protein [Ferviditalea candida]|uniref:DUF3050 domain-containing protein n=1 Tax=Ferviditalea candida TaxID=3108399 RepID=A0ABU5ZG51_9BACL|nr:DUF3050 domain-containing protein [Paenibacillaceae bacterium T2]
MDQQTFSRLKRLREELLEHPVYTIVNTPERVKYFMQHHVFAVWDFMSLLKKLQNVITCVTVPWVPGPDANYARFINEIVLGEETDEDGEGHYISHYELYLNAMGEVGADVSPIRTYVERVAQGENPFRALEDGRIPDPAADFVRSSLQFVFEGKPHEVAAAFFFGREEIIPDMFQVLVDELQNSGIETRWLDYYLRRHIELDENEHGPLAEKLLYFLCGSSEDALREAEEAAQRALQARIRLWDGVVEGIREQGI